MYQYSEIYGNKKEIYYNEEEVGFDVKNDVYVVFFYVCVNCIDTLIRKRYTFERLSKTKKMRKER